MMKPDRAENGESFAKKAARYLERVAAERNVPWRNREAFARTVEELESLDGDLKECLLSFMDGETVWHSSPGCEIASMRELVECGGFSPVTAALVVQWYRQDPKSAAAFLLQNDSITDIPDDIPAAKE